MSGLSEQAQTVLTERSRANNPPLREAPVMLSRALQWEWLRYQGDICDVARVEDRFIPSKTAEIPVRIYTPHGSGPFPALVVFHGGCWIVGNIDLADRPHRALAAKTGCLVVAVNYQKAPEHPYPIPLDDCYAGLTWTVTHAAEIGADPARIGVAGDSAGGNLAAAVSLRARERGDALPAVQVLMYPVLDSRLDTASTREFAEGYGLTTEDMRWSWKQYAAGESLIDPLLSPSYAGSLTGLPPAIVVTAEFDILRDEGTAYADRLASADVPTVALQYPGAIHGFLWMGGAVDVCTQMLNDVRDNLRRLWGQQ